MKHFYIVLLILLSSCSLFEQTKSGEVQFESGSDNRKSRAVVNYSTYEVDESMNSIVDGYTAYGNKIGAYTPTEFSISLNLFHFVKAHLDNMTIPERSTSMYMAVSLAEGMTYDKRDKPELFTANFIDDVSLYPDEDFQVQVYDGININFQQQRINYSPSISQNKTYISKSESMITVHIPGYENVWPDQSYQNKEELIEQFKSWSEFTFDDSSVFDVIDETRQFINNADGSLSFGLEHLQGSYGLFFDMYSDTIQLAENPLGEKDIIVIPFEGLHINKDTSAVIIKVIWDLDNIIELYDNNTPELLSDDILVLASDYWKRLSVEITEH
ncbi:MULTISPECIES: hypothetical protein [unclassified Oceanispirochaeta]|uniref:hypothetical protein n=1 Tax=unclassified Oceanispirochaeta TaxID=2635722 RepID=UPI000E0917E3|nr:MULTISPECIES: hypothetical protein [unclassified Oceanispirochaeta]MBF9014408.1 hypothetical protein [Oceanispirochaeta sp. M2]NPD71294.1 hypothetical protein [Oceanispirochaeta sp. M1]RDG33675.1 hypothetical protein DV872_04190 [Oceanispirochaeta sp. M1]